MADRTIVEVYRDGSGPWRWRALRSGRVIAVPGESFTRKWSAKRSARASYGRDVHIVVVKDARVVS